MKWVLHILGGLLLLVALAAGSAVAGFHALRWYYGPELPDVEGLRDLEMQVPLRVYTADGKLIGEFGAERRAPLRFDQFPATVIDAFLAAEDDRFFEHPGVDWQGLARASFRLATTGERSQGGSTITMQLARNVFLTPERSYERKIREILLALAIEERFSKQEILEIYLNKIFLGQRAYGVGAAAPAYFGVDVARLDWSQAALLAGLPKAPSRDNPVTSPERAKERRNYVLRRLRDLGKIDENQYRAALEAPIRLSFSLPKVEADARYVAEMVRADLYARFGEAAYTRGLSVVTTIDSERQETANQALRAALTAYDERHGWRGPESRVPDDLLALVSAGPASPDGSLEVFLAALPPLAGLVPAMVTNFSLERIELLASGEPMVLDADDFAWAKLSDRHPLKPGDVVRVRRAGEGWRLAQAPQAQGALVAIDPRDGAIVALAGGYDFLENKYNRATQALRQPGSGFKPFLYAAAFDFGFTPASIVLDAPVVFNDPKLESSWRPENYGGDFKGPMRLREALVQSRNLVSIRLLQAVGLDHAINYARRFGFPLERMPRDLTLSLGSASFTPLEMARAYAVFANGGFLVDPYFVREIRDGYGQVVEQATPRVACPDCAERIVQETTAAAMDGADDVATMAEPAPRTPSAEEPNLAPRVIDPTVAWMIGDLLRDVTRRGTAAKARELQRRDIAGKTGTSNDETDAWFSGYTPRLVAVSWVGFDQPRPLGRGEVGGRAALPMWMDFMRAALAEKPEIESPSPPGLVAVRINPATGRLAASRDGNAIFETVPADRVPSAEGFDTSASQNALQELF